MTGIVEWIKERELWLKKQLNWPKGFPVVSTFTQALAHCDSKEVEQAIMQAIREATERREKEAEKQNALTNQQEEEDLKHTAMDGKTLCGTKKHQAEDQPSVHILSRYDCKTGMILDHVVLEKKMNEITGGKGFS